MKHTTIFAVALLAGCATATQVSNDIATACNDALPVINDLAPVVSVDPTGAMVVGSLQNACTASGMIQMSLNDKAPVTPINSGNSAAWVKSSVADLQTLAATIKAATK